VRAASIRKSTTRSHPKLLCPAAVPCCCALLLLLRSAHARPLHATTIWAPRSYWCMPQRDVPGHPRTEAEASGFKHMLKNQHFLYLGCKVLILLDRKFMGRFWTQYATAIRA
jgi:hypothetical protein